MKTLIYLLLGLICSVGITQQEQQFTQYMVNPYTINPALGGTEDFTDIKLGYRRQWVGFDASPRTYYLTGHTTLGKEFNASGYHHKTEHTSWHGVGGYVYSDRTGPISRSAFYGQYSYNLPLTRKVRLSVGSFFGVKQVSYDLSGLKKEDAVDDAIPNNTETKILPDLTIGVWAYSEYWYVGVSAFQLLQNNISFGELASTLNNGQLVSHLFITGGVKLPVNETWTVVPSFALKGIINLPPSLDLNVKLSYKDHYFGGLSYRAGDAFAIIAGAVINKMFDLSYSYDITTSNIRQASSGSHEIVIGVRLKHPDHIHCASRFW